MPKPSAFTPFGQLAFSSRKPKAQAIYEQMRSDLGGGKNYSDDFDSVAMGRVYANAMTFARAYLALERAGSQFRPSRALELLPALEREYGLIPDAQATIADRRSELAAAMRLAGGASRVNVEFILTELLGDDFVEYETISTDDMVLSSATPGDDGIYLAPGTPRSVFRLLDSVVFTGEAVTVAYEAVVGEAETLLPGDSFVIDSGNYSRMEIVTVTSVGEDDDERPTITATFEHPHTSGVLMATGRHPYLASTKRHNIFKLSEDGMASARSQAKANKVGRQALRGVSTWALTDSDDSFTVGKGLLGVTLIGEDDLPIEEPPITTGLVLNWDLQDWDTYTIESSDPNKCTELINKVSSVATPGGALAFTPDFEPGGFGGEPCVRGDVGGALELVSDEAAVLAAVNGSDAAITVYIVVEPGALDQDSVYLGFGNSASASDEHILRFGQSATGSGKWEVRKRDGGVGLASVESTADVSGDRVVLSWIIYGTTADFYVNDGAAAPAGAAFNVANLTTTHFALFCLPANGSTESHDGSRIAQVLLYSGAHDADDHEETVDYLMTKWSI